MGIKELLTNKKIDYNDTIIKINKEKALVNFIEALNSCNLNFDFSKLSKEELEKLFNIYSESIILYHPECYHQEFATFIEAKDIFIRYGLKEEDILNFDFP